MKFDNERAYNFHIGWRARGEKLVSHLLPISPGDRWAPIRKEADIRQTISGATQCRSVQVSAGFKFSGLALELGLKKKASSDWEKK